MKNGSQFRAGLLELFQDYIVHYKLDCNVYDKHVAREIWI